VLANKLEITIKYKRVSVAGCLGYDVLVYENHEPQLKL
jgi:hypothetical protein